MPLVTRQKLTLSDADWWLDFTRDRLDGAILREKLSFNLNLLYDNTQLIEVKVSSRALPLSGINAKAPQALSLVACVSSAGGPVRLASAFSSLSHIAVAE